MACGTRSADAARRPRRGGRRAARRPDRARVLLRRLLRPAAADRRDRRVGARARARRRRPGAAPARPRRPRRARRARADDRVERALDQLGAAAGPGGGRRPAAGALHRRAARRGRRAPAPRARAVEPALAAGATIVIGYGLAGRLLPGVVELARSRSAGGRLEQPITYWNAEGALAAIGLVLCARLAGDRSRPGWMRVAAAAALAPLGAGVYLSYSRGAIAVAVLGLLALVAWAPSTAQLRAAAVALAVGVLAALGTAALPGVASLEGTHETRDGLIGLAILLVLAIAAAALAPRRPRRAALVGPPAQARGRDRARRRRRRPRDRRARREADRQAALRRRQREPPDDRQLLPLRVLAHRAQRVRPSSAEGPRRRRLPRPVAEGARHRRDRARHPLDRDRDGGRARPRRACSRSAC